MGGTEHEGLVRAGSALKMRNKAIADELVGVGLAGSERAVVPVQLIFPAGLIGQVNVEIPDAALIGCRDHKRQLVGPHA